MGSKDECLILFLVMFYNWDLSNPKTKFHKNITNILTLLIYLSSTRAKRAGPKGLRAESARALLADGTRTVGGGKTF